MPGLLTISLTSAVEHGWWMRTQPPARQDRAGRASPARAARPVGLGSSAGRVLPAGASLCPEYRPRPQCARALALATIEQPVSRTPAVRLPSSEPSRSRARHTRRPSARPHPTRPGCSTRSPSPPADAGRRLTSRKSSPRLGGIGKQVVGSSVGEAHRVRTGWAVQWDMAGRVGESGGGAGGGAARAHEGKQPSLRSVLDRVDGELPFREIGRASCRERVS